MTTHLVPPLNAKPAPADHPIHPLLRERWSPRAFSSDDLTAAELNVLFEAARWTASASNEQPWAFIVATRRQAEPFAKLVACLNPGNQVWAKDAPALAIAVVRTTLKGKGQPNRTAHYDLGQAVANFTFQATALGVAVHQMAGMNVEATRTAFQIPAPYEPVTAFAFGRPGDSSVLPEAVRIKDAAPRVRMPLTQFVFHGAWDSAR